MKIVYFDRNVFADICELRRGISEKDVSIISQAVKSKSIIIPVSLTLLEETVTILKQSDENYVRHIQSLLKLIDQTKMVKDWSELLTNACLSFITNTPFQGMEKLPNDLADILDITKNRQELIDSAESIMNRFTSSAKSIADSLIAHPNLKQEMGTPQNFRQFWEIASIDSVEAILSQENADLRKICQNMGIENLLKIKTIRIFTIYHSWIYYSGIYGVEGKPKTTKRGDIGDFFHAINASVADIFVTQEENKPNKLPFILNQIPVEDFQVMNLNEFINFLCD